MKATIKSDGTLVITAENSVEEYALTQWQIASLNGGVSWEYVMGEMTGVRRVNQKDTSGLDYSDIRLK